jgi:NAD(P)-dependent dehydrogenase (short-subunit alcohol dehydrogenase family)
MIGVTNPGRALSLNAYEEFTEDRDIVSPRDVGPSFYNPPVARIPLGRVWEPEDLAALAIHLAAPASDFITGQIMVAHGGLTATQEE